MDVAEEVLEDPLPVPVPVPVEPVELNVEPIGPTLMLEYMTWALGDWAWIISMIKGSSNQ